MFQTNPQHSNFSHGYSSDVRVILRLDKLFNRYNLRSLKHSLLKVSLQAEIASKLPAPTLSAYICTRLRKRLHQFCIFFRISRSWPLIIAVLLASSSVKLGNVLLPATLHSNGSDEATPIRVNRYAIMQ